MIFLFIHQCAYRRPLSRTVRIKETMSTTTTTTAEIKDEAKADMCPICMDDLPLPYATNRVTTECGHTFHTSCLMSSVAHGKYRCPCCRTEMAEEPEPESDSDDSDDEYNLTEQQRREWERQQRREWERQRLRNIDIGFQGMRLMFQREMGEELEEKSEDEIEDEMEEIAAEIAAGRCGEPEPKPSVEYLAESLLNQDVTVQDMVKALLLDHEEYEDDEEEFMEASDDIFGRLRILISNYNHHPPPASRLEHIESDLARYTISAAPAPEPEPDSLEDVFYQIDRRLQMEKKERGLMEKEDQRVIQ